jgi:hypothetical protein
LIARARQLCGLISVRIRIPAIFATNLRSSASARAIELLGLRLRKGRIRGKDEAMAGWFAIQTILGPSFGSLFRNARVFGSKGVVLLSIF